MAPCLGEQLVHEAGAADRLVPCPVVEPGGRALHVPLAGRERVVVQAQAVHVPGRSRHEHLGPLVVVGVRPARDLRDRLVAVLAHVGLVLPVQVRVVQRKHVAAASPALVADAEELEPEGLITPVALAQIRHGGARVEGHVLHPVGHLGDRAAADVAVDVRLGIELVQQLEVLVRAERVGLDDPAPVRVDHRLPLGPDAFPPVILVGEASARPPHDGHFDRAERVDGVAADAVLVRDAGVGADPQALVDAAAEMLRELSIDATVDRWLGVSATVIMVSSRQQGGDGARRPCFYTRLRWVVSGCTGPVLSASFRVRPGRASRSRVRRISVDVSATGQYTV